MKFLADLKIHFRHLKLHNIVQAEHYSNEIYGNVR